MKKLKVMLALLLALLMLAGCGNTKKADDSSSAAEEAKTEEPAAEEAKAEEPAAEEAKAEEPAAEAKAAAAPSKTVNIAISENAVTLDPHYTAQTGVQTIRELVFERLVYYVENDDGSITYVPQLAKEWTTSDDGLEWTFYLRDDVTFHNGEAFTAADCAATFQRLMDNMETLTIANTYWAELDHYEVVDDYTFKLVMTEPLATVLIGCVVTAILPDEAWAEYGEDFFNKQLMYGTGPWVFDEWIDGQYAHLTKNENYWGDFDSYYDDMYIRFITEESTAIASMLAGDVDVYARSGGITNSSLQLFDGYDDIDLVTTALASELYLGFQCGEDSPFKDPDVRKAFSLAIDRKAIIDSILGSGTVPNSFLVKGVLGYDESLPEFQYDPEAAKELLANSSYNGEAIMLSSNTGTTQSAEILPVIAEMVNDVGFNASSEIVESATLLDMRLAGNYDVFMVNGMFGLGDPYTLLTQRVRNDYHTSEYVNEEMNDLITQSNMTIDQEERKELLMQVNSILTENMAPMIPIAQLNQTCAVRKGITGVEFYTSGWFDFKLVSYEG